MNRRFEAPSTRRHVFIYDEDWQFLQSAYGATSSKAVRNIVHSYVSRLQEQVNQKMQARAAKRPEEPKTDGQ